MLFRRRNRTQCQPVTETGVEPVGPQESEALDRAEQLCDAAEALHDDAAVQAERVLTEARADATRLLRQALAVVDENVSRSQAARRQQELDRAAAEAARVAAERLLERARQMQELMTAESVAELPYEELPCDELACDELPCEQLPEDREPAEGLLTATIIDFESAQWYRRTLSNVNR